MRDERIRMRRPLIGVHCAAGAEADASSPTLPSANFETTNPWTAIQESLTALVEDVREIEQRRKQSLTELQEATVELSLTIASHIVQHKIERNEFPIERIVKKMVAHLEPEPCVTIRLNPKDLEVLRDRLDGQPSTSENDNDIRLVADASLPRGDCAAEAGDFGLVSRIETQQSELRQLILENLEDAQVEHRKTQTGNEGIRRYPDRRETA
jgi:flagellar biosynthesis/type III secretory pathway protein FliH